MVKKQYTTINNILWIQPDGPGGDIYPLDCTDLPELKEMENSISTLLQLNSDRSGWDVIGETVAPPDKMAFTLTLPEYQARSLLESVECPFTIYWTQVMCGKVNDFANVERGQIVQHVRRVGRGFGDVVHRKDDLETNLTIDVEAWPNMLNIDDLVGARIATTEANALNDVWANLDLRCLSDCGDTISKGELAEIACDAGAGVTANVLRSTDFAETFAAMATDPFAVNLNIMAGCRVQVGNVTRIIVGREGTGAVQGLMGYTDNNGAAWTTVNIGGAAVGHGPVYGHGLWALDRYHIWCASDDGYIYKSVNAGLSWVAKEAGTIHVGANYFVHFADSVYGLVGGAAGVTSISDDGGESWYAGGIPVASPARCGWRIDKTICWVGCDNGNVYRSTDGGLTWTNPFAATGNPWPAGSIRSMWWCNEYQGFLLHNTAAPVGTLYRTVNGGATWEAITTPTNSGVNSVFAPKPNLVYVVGEANAATGFIAKFVNAYV